MIIFFYNLNWNKKKMENLVLYEELRGSESGPWERIPTHTCFPVTMWGFSNWTPIGIPSSEINGFNGESVPLVKITDRMPWSTNCCILDEKREKLKLKIFFFTFTEKSIYL